MRNKTLAQLYAEHAGKVSDRWSIYLTEYERIFRDFRAKPIRLLEIGIQNGGSLEIWSKYFPHAQKLVGCDINPDCAHLSYEDPRIAVVVEDANSDAAQLKILGYAPAFDLIIDDGSHRSSDIVKSFARYFPNLADQGVFIIEDLHCSYWKEYEGGLFDPYSSITFLKRLADIVSHEHWGVEKAPSEILGGFFSRYGFHIDPEALQHVHSVEFINSLSVIRKAPPERNRLGTRAIAGTVEMVASGHLELRGSAFGPDLVPDQSGNEWAARSMPPDEELLIQMKELAERDGQIATLNQAVTERDRQIANLSHSLAETRNSTSWRVTAPFRSIGGRVRRVRAYWRNLQSAVSHQGGTVGALRKALQILRSCGVTAVIQKLKSIGETQAQHAIAPVDARMMSTASNIVPDVAGRGTGAHASDGGPFPANQPLTRFQKICGNLNLKGNGVELGPSHNPILPKSQGYRVTVVDHLDTDKLRTKYKLWNIDTSAIEDVDVVWNSGSLAEVLKDRGPFDFIVASHFIEHVPDPIRFLQDCRTILKPDGKLSLVVPDKRYCFDYYRQLTTTGEWVEAYLERHSIHPPRKHFDSHAYATTKGSAIAWGKGTNDKISLQNHTLFDAYEKSRESHATKHYRDVHGWQFTPESFGLVLNELRHLGLIAFSVVNAYPTEGFEFYVTLEPDESDFVLSKADREALIEECYSPKQ